jgi:hypothetical protein
LVFLGIGFVPADVTRIPGGYANTTMDSTYFFQVKDAPFGGTLSLMINHDLARTMGANFYKVLITPAGGMTVEADQPYSDYRWNAGLNRHAADEIWLNYWLGMLLETVGLPNGLNKISIKLFGSQDVASEIGPVDQWLGPYPWLASYQKSITIWL